MIIKFKTTPDGSKFMDITELKNLDDSFSYFLKDRANAVVQKAYFQHLQLFLDFCIKYADDVFKGKTYTYDHVIPQLFITTIKGENQYKQYLRYALYAALQYARVLRNKIALNEIDNYDDLTLTLCTDYEWLIASYEHHVLGHTGITIRHGSRKELSVMDIKWGASQLMFAEHTGSLRQFDYRNTKPYVMFMVRQCLEMLGKNMLGFASINDKSGKPIHQFTQVAWTFLHDMEKQGKNLISLPLKASSIHQLNSWSNSFVHTSFIYSSYTQYYALDALYEFSQPAKNPVEHVFGRSQSLQYGDYRIHNLAQLRQEFEEYCTKQHGGYPVYIEWLDPKEVGAYILNLGPLPEKKRGCLVSLIPDWRKLCKK